MPLQGTILMAGITAACGMGFLLFGYDQGVMGGVIGSPTFVKQFNNPNALKQGLIVGLYDIGCLFGSLAAFFFSERLGRKKSIYCGALIVIVGTILQITANTIGHLIAGRIVTGLGVGINTAVIPTWQSEVSPAKHRGILVTIEAALIILGLTLANWICYGASYASSAVQWRLPIALQIIFALYLLATVPFLVESPRWLANHHSVEAATVVIARLRGHSQDHPEVITVISEIQKALEEEEGNSNWLDIFQNGGQQNFRRMALGFIGLYMQQMSGINAVAYYLPVILNTWVGLSSNLSHILSSCAAMQFFVVSLLPIWFIERAGRRNCMIWGAVAQTIVMVLICVGFNISTKPGAILITTMYFLFYDAFAVSFLNVPWMYAPEINNLKMRAKGAAMASASNWLFNGIVVTITPIGMSNLGWKYYIIWAVLNASFVPLVYFCYPETKGLSLEQIDHIFHGRKQTLTQGVKESLRMPRSGDGLQDARIREDGAHVVQTGSHIGEKGGQTVSPLEHA